MKSKFTVFLAICMFAFISLKLNSACPKYLYYEQLLPLFEGLKINSGIEELQKQSGTHDQEIKTDLATTRYPGYFIWADLVSDNGKVCTYDYRRGISTITASKIPFIVAYVVGEPEFTMDSAINLLKLQKPLNLHDVNLRFKNSLNQFNNDQEKSREKIDIFNRKRNAYSVVISHLGGNFEQFRRELDEEFKRQTGNK